MYRLVRSNQKSSWAHVLAFPWSLTKIRATAFSLQQVILGRMVSGFGGAGMTAMVSVIITGRYVN